MHPTAHCSEVTVSFCLFGGKRYQCFQHAVAVSHDNYCPVYSKSTLRHVVKCAIPNA